MRCDVRLAEVLARILAVGAVRGVTLGLALCAGPGAQVWAATVAAEPARAATSGAQGDEWIYRVQPGDTLVDIAARHLAPAHDWPALARHNRLADPAVLKPGSRLSIPLAWLRHDPSGAEVLHLRGPVQRLVGGQAVALAVGDRLQPGEVVETGAQASATLRFADGSRLLVTSGSRLRIDRAGRHADSQSVDTRVRVDRGSAETQVDPRAGARRRFEISTPIVNIGVRGTDFRTHAGGRDSQVEVLSGEVAADGAMAVRAGFGIVAQPGVPLTPPLPLAPAPDLSAVPPTLDHWPQPLAWAAAPGAQAYRAQLWTTAQPPALLLDGRFTAPAASWPSPPDGRYQLRVRVVDVHGLEGLDASAALRLLTQPPPPAPLQPAPGARERQRSLNLRWAPVAGSAGYRLQLAGPAGFAAPQADLLLGPVTSAALLLAPGAYQWRLASLAPDGERGPFGAAVPFVVQPLPLAPEAGVPVARAGQLAWAWQPTGPEDRYELQVAHEAGFAQPMRTLVLAATRVALPLAEPGRYALRVRALTPDGLPGPYSEVRWVDVAPRRWWHADTPSALPAP